MVKNLHDFDIPEEDKKKIEEVVKNTLNREGLLALTYRTDAEWGDIGWGQN